MISTETERAQTLLEILGMNKALAANTLVIRVKLKVTMMGRVLLSKIKVMQRQYPTPGKGRIP